MVDEIRNEALETVSATEKGIQKVKLRTVIIRRNINEEVDMTTEFQERATTYRT